MTTKQAYQWLTNRGLQWDRKDDSHIIVWTSGYKTQDCYDTETILAKAKMCSVEQSFDSICGKTFTIYKHKQGA